jgi:thiamine-phosphate pyrophosphorylase
MRPLPQREPVYAIADLAALGRIEPAAAVEEMAQQGVRWIQLRAKPAPSDRELYRLAERCCRRLEGTPARLWIDDRADVAVLVAAAGVHVGQRDLPAAAARRAVGESLWIGQSTHDAAQLAAAADDDEVDVVAVGPVFATASKRDPGPLIGLAGVRRARAATTKPLVAIGGIDASNAAQVLAAGADSVAVLGAVCRASQVRGIGRNCRRLLAAVEGAR